MAECIDRMGNKIRVEYSVAYTPEGEVARYVNQTRYLGNSAAGSTVQLTIKAFKELKLEIQELKIED